jgi:Cu/Zn superoxide dismutase
MLGAPRQVVRLAPSLIVLGACAGTGSMVATLAPPPATPPAVIAGAPAAASSTTRPHTEREAAPARPLVEAIAVIQPTPGYHTAGTVRFVVVDDGVLMHVTIENVSGTHAIEIAVGGNCSPSARTARPRITGGDEIVPGPLATLRDDGRLALVHETLLPGAVLQGDLVGRAVVIHWTTDNEFIAPDRRRPKLVGCGVIAAATP